MKNYLFIMLLFSSLTLAQTSNNYINDVNTPEREINIIQPIRKEMPYQKISPNEETLTISKEDLDKYPEIIVRALIPVLIKADADKIKLLLPIYQKKNNVDDNIVLWSKAILARQERDYSTSVILYRKLLNHLPLTVVKFQFAETLFFNQNNVEARDWFKSLLNEDLPINLKNIIENYYLLSLEKRDALLISGGANYLYEENINNAPPENVRYYGFKPWKKESGKGIGYQIGINKRFSLPKGFFSELSSKLSGKYYWDNKKYNQIELRNTLGMGYQTAKYQISLNPFLENRWYAGGASGKGKLRSYSENIGVNLNYKNIFSQNWQLFSQFEYAKENYQQRKYLNGNHYLISNTLFYIPTNKQYWFFNVAYDKANTQDKDDSYSKVAMKIGWEKEWQFNMATNISFTYATKKYKSPGRLLPTKQKNNERIIKFSVWNKKINILGITPRLTWIYQDQNSNHPFYQYNKHQVVIEVNKSFSLF
ncbi:surface lipoprotein assembly modifier [Gallibacterium trehalosifermentans]|uniref:Surface lipoprotein assembly modifier n=1 Tax=Gallibacterium trehalosifermentans TaxID=516935 RepID=A0ABV6H306_9PAST